MQINENKWIFPSARRIQIKYSTDTPAACFHKTQNCYLGYTLIHIQEIANALTVIRFITSQLTKHRVAEKLLVLRVQNPTT